MVICIEWGGTSAFFKDCLKLMKIALLIITALLGALSATAERNATGGGADLRTLEEVKVAGRLRSSFLGEAAESLKQSRAKSGNGAPEPNLAGFRKDVLPAITESCVACHGPKKQKGKFRVDTLDPDLLHGGDVDWWLDVFEVLSNSEMPPGDEEEFKLTDSDRAKMIDWLAGEIQVASEVSRHERGHSSFRRMTRYEYNYALGDLLGLGYDFAADLPPETTSEDGFENSSDMLQMSVMQFEYYRELGRDAIKKATVQGDQPKRMYFGITMEAGAKQMVAVRNTKKPPSKFNPKSAHFKNLETGEGINAGWNYRGARQSWPSSATRPQVPAVSPNVLIVPSNKTVVFELGKGLPDRGNLRVRIRAARGFDGGEGFPSVRLSYGFHASNNSKAVERVSQRDVAIHAVAGEPKFYEWDIALSEIIRNPLRHTGKMGETPSPTEFLILENTSISQADLQIDYLEVIAPYYAEWPPQSHRRVFIDSEHKDDEAVYAREVLGHFMGRAWRRPVSAGEIDRKVALFERFRGGYDDFEGAMVEVLATVISSPHFLYLVQANPARETSAIERVTDFELATRLSMFLWCSGPDDELLTLAGEGKLGDADVLVDQVERMLGDERSKRFSKHFVRQWLGMQLLDFLNVDKKMYPQFDAALKEAMQQEPVAFFNAALQSNRSVMDFLHADYAQVNERLAKHYGLENVYGNHFRQVALEPGGRRGGLLTQAGLLAMNSDGADSHPLKRGIWMLERLLNDPPPPPPPAVPEIDLADPEIAKLTLKQRIENHRDDPACLSCHEKIDPWGIAFENFDAVGSWRDTINNIPVDASSLLFNKQELRGMDGLKRYLLANRQDQFARAIVHKMTTYALGRPLTFSDRASVDELTGAFRNQEDRLGDLVKLIVMSDLFQTK